MPEREERSLRVRLPDELLQALRRLAQEDARSLNSEVVWALRRFAEQRQHEISQLLKMLQEQQDK